MILAMSVSFIHCLVLKSAFPWDKYWNSFPCQEVRWKFLNVVHQFYVSWGIAGKSSISEVSRKVTSLKTLHPDMPNCQIVSWNISTRYVRKGEKKREGQYTAKCIQCQQMVVSLFAWLLKRLVALFRLDSLPEKHLLFGHLLQGWKWLLNKNKLAKLSLTNLLTDRGRHIGAKGHYRKYLRKYLR